MKKRFLAMALAVLMAVSILPVSALAEDFNYFPYDYPPFGSNSNGGAIYFGSGTPIAPVTIPDDIFGSNRSGGVIIVSPVKVGDDSGNGGAIISSGDVPVMGENVKFEGNTTEAHGGAIYFDSNTQAPYKGVEFTPNESTSSGGAIINEGRLLLGESVKFTASNEADIVPLILPAPLISPAPVIAPAPLAEDNTMLNFCVDVKTNDYFYDAVLWFYENGYTKGVDEVHFAPHADITRGEIITLLWRMAGSPVVNYRMQMTDVESGAYYTEAVRWALSEKIATGTSKTTFEPDRVCTRGEMITILWNLAGKPVLDYSMALDDVKSGAYYTEAVRWALSEKLTAGTSGTTFSPDRNCSRAEAATLFYRYFDGHKVTTTPGKTPLAPVMADDKLVDIK